MTYCDDTTRVSSAFNAATSASMSANPTAPVCGGPCRLPTPAATLGIWATILMTLKLRRLGHEVEAASDGINGLRQIVDGKPDLAVIATQ